MSMSFGRPFPELGRRAAACLAVALALSAVTASAAAAETTFGGNPGSEAIPELLSEVSCVPFTCTLFWNGPGATDLAPIPPGGGSGTVTSVTLPAMLDPGMMQAVVLTTSTQATRDPAHPTTTCCTVKELSPPFTVPPGVVTTVPLSLHVAASAAANLGVPGDTSTADGVGISVIDPEASAPLRSTENPADDLRLWSPALTAPSTGAAAPTTERAGYELEARFTFLETPGAGKPPSPGGPGSPGAGAGPDARSGLRLRRGALRPGHDGRTLILGTATNPPAASTKQTLTARVPGASAASGKATKPLIVGFGRTTVPNGGKAVLKLSLNGRGRAALAEGHKLKATLTVLATNPEGESGTLTRRVRVVEPPAKPKRSR